MLKILGRLFSSPEIVGKTVDAVINTGDALFFTDEEKSAANQKKLDWLLKFHEASSGSNVARRIIALGFVAVFLLHVITVTTLTLFGNDILADKVFQLIAMTMVEPIVWIMGFYFGHGIVKNIRK